MSDAAPVLAVDSRCQLGECVLWCDRREALFWTDITGRRLWMHRPGGDGPRHWRVPAPLGCFALCADGRLLLGLAKGLALVDPDAGDGPELALTPVAQVEPEVGHTRVNDGRADREGNLVFGSKCERDDASTCGRWYQFSFAHGLRRLALPDAAIPNSICFSRDGRTLYFCDSRLPRILCCAYDAKSAEVSDIRPFALVAGDAASPDGSVVDAEGCLWNAQWGAARVVRYGPDGAVRDVVPIPVKNPSCCAFGGAALDQLYVTTAREDMSEAELAATPEAGGLYRVSVPGARGLPEDRVAIA